MALSRHWPEAEPNTSWPPGRSARCSPPCKPSTQRLRGWVLDERAALRRHINVYVNGERGGTDTVLSPGDRVEVLPAISGG